MKDRGFAPRFNAEEWAGAVGDFGTLLPIAFGVAMVTGMNLSSILLGFGLAYIFTGLYYRLPMPVEPMKAIGVVAIAGTLTSGQVIASGLMLGILLLLLGYSGTMGRLRMVVRDRVIRGVQLGLALLLIKVSFDFMRQDVLLAVGACLIIIGFQILRFRDVSALAALGLGILVGVLAHGFPPIVLSLPISPVFPRWADFPGALYQGVLPQLPLTVANAIFATSLLTRDLLNQSVSDDRLAKTMGGMCLVGGFLGAMPMCHGSGGLAAQYRFGARTGGSNLISGLILLVLAMFVATPHVLPILPVGVLGALLLFSSVELVKVAFRTDGPLVTLLTGILAPLTNLGLAFVAGLATDIILRRALKVRGGRLDGRQQ